MIPTSLRIALLVGMGSGIITALVLADIRDNQEILFVAYPSLTILTEKSDYKKGEPVTIRIINSGNETLSFSDSSYGLRITGLAGMLMFDPSPSTEISDGVELTPRDEHVMIWNQQKDNEQTVHDGIYKISIHGFDASGNKIEQTKTINIFEIDLTFGS